MTVVYEVPDDFSVTRITGTGQLDVVASEWIDALARLAAAEALCEDLAVERDDAEALLREALDSIDRAERKCDDGKWYVATMPDFINRDWQKRAIVQIAQAAEGGR